MRCRRSHETATVLHPCGFADDGCQRVRAVESARRPQDGRAYSDPALYALIGGELMWRRSFGRARNEMVLPAGWYLTTSSVPATVAQADDGRIRLTFWNSRNDSIDVFVKARKR